jgi:hypothetical protein
LQFVNYGEVTLFPAEYQPVNRRTALTYLASAAGGGIGGVFAMNWKPSLSAVWEGASPYCRPCGSDEHVGRVLVFGCVLPRDYRPRSAEEVARDEAFDAACEREKVFFVGCPVQLGQIPRWGCHSCHRTWGRQPDEEASGWLKTG